MFKKIAVAVLSAVLLVVSVALPVSAASVTAGTGSRVYVGWDSNAGPVINGNRNTDGSYWINYYEGRTDTELGILYPIDLVINRGDVVKWSSFYANFYFSLSYTPTITVVLGLMDEKYNLYDLEVLPSDDDFLDGSFDVQFKGGSLQFPEDLNAKYICIMLNGMYNQSSAGTFGWYPYSFRLSSMDENSILLEGVQSEQQETNNKLDELLQQPEQEKQEAGGSGNNAVDGLTSAIPADNDGVIAAMRNLSAAMSYTGTDCKWIFPALYIPAIDGVTPRIDLTSEKDINFTEWIEAMPTDVIEVVRIIATIALILYCFKELYSLIKYILTMKGGGGGNE